MKLSDMARLVHRSCALVKGNFVSRSNLLSKDTVLFNHRTFLTLKNFSVSSKYHSKCGLHCRRNGALSAGSINSETTYKSKPSLLPVVRRNSVFAGGVSLGPRVCLIKAARSFHSSRHDLAQEVSKLRVNGNDECVEVTVGQQVLRIPFVWLRDHCRSERYYNHATYQKNPDAELLERDLVPDELSVTDGNSGLRITWRDGHTSEFSAKWLQENFFPGRAGGVAGRRLWNSADIQSELPRVSHAEHMESEAGLRKTLSNLITHGICLVDGAPASLDGTQAVVERVCFVQRTIFGEMWSFSSNAARSDTAYTGIALGAHTDTTYMDLPAGIQVFQCLEHNGSGGKTLLVDGFRAIEELRQTNPEAYDVLCRAVVPHEYVEDPCPHSPGYHLHSLGTVIQAHPASGETIQLRFNPYDRAPLNTVAPESLEQFYRAYDQLSRIIARKEGELWVKLTPGTVLLVDNWRVMHGRSAYDGHRVICGCYLPRDEWISKARVMGLL
ncbi:trimethyllysine dioxygenase, mitochondrial [Aplysia californica]|uniref:Trimethyllysine dioxygenase, mitochondrial n=1 Tax=Aplysia californica TaxID=6500 RepID=A0ABM0K2Y0_APLCA|nr:trimethyllysine dioxygenase, mitochondrial [Aplysia californica]XP_012943050.1 trimethyllysine dioxygenase, mitochondrial [Aplysia californica]